MSQVWFDLTQLVYLYMCVCVYMCVSVCVYMCVRCVCIHVYIEVVHEPIELQYT